MLENVKVGDKLWSPVYGWGEVVGPNSGKVPLCIEFDDRYEYYLIDGIDGIDGMENGRQILFWDEIDMTPPPKPKREITVEGWVNLYGRRTKIYAGTPLVFICDSSSLFETKEMADKSVIGYPGRLGKAVYIKHTYTEID